MSKKRFALTCIYAVGDDINDMKEHAEDITRGTFCRHVDRESREGLERQIGYEVGPSRGLHMKDDWAVGYYKGAYQGIPCVYFQWSGIEHIFV